MVRVRCVWWASARRLEEVSGEGAASAQPLWQRGRGPLPPEWVAHYKENSVAQHAAVSKPFHNLPSHPPHPTRHRGFLDLATPRSAGPIFAVNSKPSLTQSIVTKLNCARSDPMRRQSATHFGEVTGTRRTHLTRLHTYRSEHRRVGKR